MIRTTTIRMNKMPLPASTVIYFGSPIRVSDLRAIQFSPQAAQSTWKRAIHSRHGGKLYQNNQKNILLHRFVVLRHHQEIIRNRTISKFKNAIAALVIEGAGPNQKLDNLKVPLISCESRGATPKPIVMP